MSIILDYTKSSRMGKLICDGSILNDIRNHFSAKNDGASFAKKKGYRFVSDRKYAITPTGSFEFGMYHQILQYLVQKQYTEIQYTDSFKESLNCGVASFEFINNLKNEPRYFQTETVEECLKHGRGTVLIGTGGGKSFCQALLIENFKVNKFNNKPFKCLIIVPGLSLVQQLQNDFRDYGVSFKFSGWTGTSQLQNTEVVICNSENLTSKFQDNLWILDVDLLITDECHKINASSNITKLIGKIKTSNKFGFTGTLSENKLDQWKTIGTFGPVLYEKKSKELRDEKFLTDVSVTVLKLIHPRHKKMTYDVELQYLYSNDKRNEIIKKLAKNISNNTLILVNHLVHGDKLLSVMSDIEDKEVFFVKGEMPVEDRQEIIQKLENGQNVICIAMSSIFSTGINIKNLHNIFFVGLGKSFIRTVQSIGRGLRLHESKNKLTILDICDSMKFSEKHSEERMSIYDKEQISYKQKEINLC